MSKLAAAAALLAFAVDASQAAPSSQYVVGEITVTELGTLGGDESVAHDINNAGHIVGWARTANGVQHAFRYRNGVMEDLGSVLGDLESVALGINSQSRAVGYFLTGGGFTGYHGIYWASDGGAVALRERWVGIPTDYDATGSLARAINDAGNIVGWVAGASSTAFTSKKATRWASTIDNPRMLFQLNQPYDEAISSDAYDVSNNGHIVGFDLRFYSEGYRMHNGTYVLVPEPAAAPGGSFGPGIDASGVNDYGHVVGYVQRYVEGSSSRRAYLWNGSSQYATNLGVLSSGRESVASEVNAQDFVVGYADRQVFSGAYRDAAFLWHAHFGLTKLPAPAGFGTYLSPSTCQANAVNDRVPSPSGLVQIVGYCTDGSKRRAVRWDVIVNVQTIYAPSSSSP